VHALWQRATPVDRHRPDPRHLCGNGRLCGVAQLEVIRAAPTGHEALAADCLVNLEEENTIKYLGEARASQGDRLNEEKAYAPFLRRSAQVAERRANDRPLQRLKAMHHCGIGKRPGCEESAVEAPIWATRIRDDVKDRIAERRIICTRRAQQRINIKVLHSSTDGLVQLGARNECCRETALP
jgi:hypothetical protein